MTFARLCDGAKIAYWELTNSLPHSFTCGGLSNMDGCFLLDPFFFSIDCLGVQETLWLFVLNKYNYYLEI